MPRMWMNLLAVLVIVCLAEPWVLACPSPPKCFMQFKLHNRERLVTAAWLQNECPGDFPHTAPFGNWAVDSGWGAPKDGKQFQGWKASFFQRHWNACTSNQEQYPFGDSTYYNFPNGIWNQQVSSTGMNRYTETGGRLEPAICPFFENGGCAEYDGSSFVLFNEWRDLYELDPGQDYRTDPDAFVDRLVVLSGISIWPIFCTTQSCYSLFAFSPPTPAYNYIFFDISTNVYMEFLGGQFSDPDDWCGCSGEEFCEPPIGEF